MQGDFFAALQSGASPPETAARYYQLTPTGRKQVAVETSQVERVVAAMTRVIEAV